MKSAKIDEMFKKLQSEKALNEWAVKLSRESKKGRFKESKRQKLIV
ncbi:MAG: hypothetical protein WC254_07850 [Candidatus Woesearchaeota archaeon]|jgi:hypothetical protein